MRRDTWGVQEGHLSRRSCIEELHRDSIYACLNDIQLVLYVTNQLDNIQAAFTWRWPQAAVAIAEATVVVTEAEAVAATSGGWPGCTYPGHPPLAINATSSGWGLGPRLGGEGITSMGAGAAILTVKREVEVRYEQMYTKYPCGLL